MSDPGPTRAEQEAEPGDSSSRGPNLTLIYSLIVLAMITALGCAALIVLPFYNRR